MSAVPPRPDLPPLLVSRGYLTQEQVDEARKRGGEGTRFAEIVVGLGLITEDQIHFAVSGETGFPYLHLSADMVDQDVVARFPAGSLVRHGVVPLLEDPEELSVAMSDPWDEGAMALLEKGTTKVLNISLAARGNVTEVLRAVLGRQSAEVEATAVAIEDGTGIALVYQQLLGAAAEGAQQIHFDCAGEQLLIRFRVNGKLISRSALPAAMALSLFTRLKVLAGVDPFDQREYRKTGIRSQLAGKEMDVTYAWAPTPEGGSAVITLQPLRGAGAPRTTAEILGDEALAARVLADLGRPGGIVGLGTQRNAAEAAGLIESLLSAAAAAGSKVVALGSAAGEPKVPGVLTLAAGEGAGPGHGPPLASALALAPDLIHVRGAADPERLTLAIEAAMAGTAVLVDLGYRRAADVLAHLMGSTPSQRVAAAACVTSAVAVRGVSELCPTCRAPVDAASEQALELLYGLDDRTGGALASSGWFESPGCEACKGTGRTGRILLAERIGITGKARLALRDSRLDEAMAHARTDSPELAWIASGRIGVEDLG